MRKTNIMKATLFIISFENICCWLTALKLDFGIFWLFPVHLFWMTVAFGIAWAETACVIVIRPTATDAWWLSPTAELLFHFTSYFSISRFLSFTQTHGECQNLSEKQRCGLVYDDDSSTNLSSEAAALLSWQIFTTLPPLQGFDGSDKGTIWQLDFNGAFKGHKEA